MLFGIPIEFLLFALTLLGVALFHHHTLLVALGGLAAVALYRLVYTDFSLATHLAHEWVTLSNLLGLLMGFALLADHFEKSGLPAVLPAWLPDDWKGGFVLLLLVAVISAFLDNIAAAIIGGAMASVLYQHKVHTGFLAAIVAASNAGGAGSVVGDTTTTMIWIAGGAPAQVATAWLGSIVAIAFFGLVASRQQHAYQPILKDAIANTRIDGARLIIVALILLAAIATNVLCNLFAPALLQALPVIGMSVCAMVLLTSGWRKPTWSLLPEAFRGALFLLSLVLCASMMPVRHLPEASWQTTLGLGFVSAVFDNIPLTALALRQGGYDWGFLAFAVGFGGSMVWFGSSAGVALSGLYPQAKSVGAWLKAGWHVALAYVAGYAVMLFLLGWHPRELSF